MAYSASARAVRLFVFSHPNHELAVFGLLGRPEAHVLILSDGGGAARVAQSRRGLGRLGLEERTTFLPVAETAFYEALLAKDRGLFHEYVHAVRRAVEHIRPDEVYCDAVELYNPGHDMSLPIVRAALGRGSATPVYEVPLIHLRADAKDAFRVQQAPPSLQDRRHVVRLTPEEAALKTAARDEVYTELAAQMRADLLAGGDGQLAREEVLDARALPLNRLPPDVGMRYEARGALLQSQGHVEEVLTYEEHWLPMVRDLLAGAEAGR